MVEQLLKLADEFFRAENWESASAAFETIIKNSETHSVNPLILNNLGRCYLGQSDWRKAEDVLLKASTKYKKIRHSYNTTAKQTFFGLGKAKFELHKYEEAKQAYQTAMDIYELKDIGIE